MVDPDRGTPGNTTTFTAVPSDTSLVTVTADATTGALTITPQPNQSGRTTITVTVRNTNGGPAVTSTFDVIVNAINLAPTGVVDNYTVPANGVLRPTVTTGLPQNNTRGILANDTDPENDALNAEIVAPPSRGTLLLNADGTFTYTPNNNSVAGDTDFFTYRAVDTQGQKSAITRVNISFTTKLPSTHQNPSNKYDVNADGVLTSIDALLVINYVSRRPGETDITTIPGAPPYRDVNGDYVISTLDILSVINQLSRRLVPNGEGEGSSSTSTSTTTSSVVSTPITTAVSIVPAITSIDVGGVRANTMVPMLPVTTLDNSASATSNASTGTATSNSSSPASVYYGDIEDEETEDVVASMVGEGALSANSVDDVFSELWS